MKVHSDTVKCLLKYTTNSFSSVNEMQFYFCTAVSNELVIWFSKLNSYFLFLLGKVFKEVYYYRVLASKHATNCEVQWVHTLIATEVYNVLNSFLVSIRPSVRRISVSAYYLKLAKLFSNALLVALSNCAISSIILGQISNAQLE